MQLPYPYFYCIFLTALGKKRQGTKPHFLTDHISTGHRVEYEWVGGFFSRMPSVFAHPIQRSWGSVSLVTEHWPRIGILRCSLLMPFWDHIVLCTLLSARTMYSTEPLLRRKKITIYSFRPVLPNPHPHPTLGFYSLLPFSVQCPLTTDQLFSTKAS